MIFKTFSIWHNIQNAICKMRNRFRKSNQIVQWIHKANCFTNTLMLMSSFFKDIFQQNVKVQKSVFMKYVIIDYTFVKSQFSQ